MRPDFIIEQIDSGIIQPRTHTVNPALAESLPGLSSFHRDILERFYSGQTVGDSQTLHDLWLKIEAEPLAKQGQGRLLISLFHPDKPIDWELAEYLIAWAQGEGASSDDIVKAFGAKQRPLADSTP